MSSQVENIIQKLKPWLERMISTVKGGYYYTVHLTDCKNKTVMFSIDYRREDFCVGKNNSLKKSHQEFYTSSIDNAIDGALKFMNNDVHIIEIIDSESELVERIGFKGVWKNIY